MFAVNGCGSARVVAAAMDWPRLLSGTLSRGCAGASAASAASAATAAAASAAGRAGAGAGGGGGGPVAPPGLSKEAVLSDHAQQRCVAALRRQRPLRVDPAAVARRAAVLVPLCLVGDDVCLLYTLRAAALRHYRGQVSFPGGMQDASDGGSLEATALREAREELGLAEGSVRVWGHGPWVGTARRDAAVLPFVAFVGPLDVRALRLCPHEVEAAFAVPLARLCDPRLFRYTQFRGSFALPVFTGGEHRIWGLTAIITHTVLKALVPAVYKHQLPKGRWCNLCGWANSPDRRIQGPMPDRPDIWTS